MNSSQTFVMRHDWRGNSGGTFVYYGNVNTGIYADDRLETGTLVFSKLKCFSPNLIYLAIIYGGFFRTNNNGGYSKILDKSIENNIVSIFPNPVTQKFNIKILSSFEDKVSYYWICNVEGKIITSSLLYKKNLPNIIDLSGFRPGIYFLNVSLNNTIVTEKIIKN
jgi:hypothetical protein